MTDFSILLKRMRLDDKMFYQEAIRQVKDDFVLTHLDEFDNNFWQMFSAYCDNVSEDLIFNLRERLEPRYLLTYRKMSEELIYKLIPENNLSAQFWVDISIYQHLSEDFMNKFSDKLHWDNISLNQKMSNQFIIDNIEKINLDSLSRNRNTSKHQLASPEFISMLALLGYDINILTESRRWKKVR